MARSNFSFPRSDSTEDRFFEWSRSTGYQEITFENGEWEESFGEIYHNWSWSSPGLMDG